MSKGLSTDRSHVAWASRPCCGVAANPSGLMARNRRDACATRSPLLLLLILLSLSSPLQAQPPAPTTLPASFGYSSLYRPNEYAPVFVTAPASPPPAPSTPRPATLEVHAYLDSRHSVITRTPIVLQPRPVTWCVPALLGPSLDGTSILLRDSDGKILSSASPGLSAVPLTPSTRLTVIAAPTSSESATDLPDSVSAVLPLSRLPTSPELYSVIDTLVLTGTTLDALSPEQADAINAYVLAGGRLVVCVPPEGLSSSESVPLADLLPARIGDLKPYALNGVTLTGRELSPLPHSRNLSPSSPIPLLAIDRGLGEVLAFPLPLSQATASALSLLLRDTKPRVQLDLPQLSSPAHPFLSRTQLASLLLLAGVLLGPLEAIRRRHFDAWPWPPHVLTGVALLAAGVTLHLLPASPKPLTPRIVVIDQTPTSALAITTLDDSASPPSEGFQRPLLPLQLPGTQHTLTLLTSDTHAVRATSRSPNTALITAAVKPTPPRVELIGFDAGSRVAHLKSSSPLTAAWLETPTAIYEGDITGATCSFTKPLGNTLPPDLAQARRLTPLRSAKLQSRLAAGSHVTLWTQDTQGVLTRTSIPVEPR